MCPLQSIPVTYTRDRCAYVVDFTLYPVESTAFGRQGPEGRILSPRPLSSQNAIKIALQFINSGTNSTHMGLSGLEWTQEDSVTAH